MLKTPRIDDEKNYKNLRLVSKHTVIKLKFVIWYALIDTTTTQRKNSNL
jgi:hypothetical protein